MKFDRRSFLGMGTGLSAAAMLTACGGSPSNGGAAGSGGGSTAQAITEEERAKALDTPTNLIFWTWVNNIENEVKLFEAKYPKIKVKVENITNHYQKLRTVLKAKSGAPDVVQMEFQYIPSFVVTKDLLDLAPYGAKDLGSQFVDWCWKQCTSGDAVWAIPQDSGPMGNLYRTDLFEKAGIAEGAKTYDEFYEQAKTMKSKTKAYLACFPPNDPGNTMGFLWQAGAKPFTYDGNQTVGINVTNEATTKVLTYWEKLIKEDVVSVDADFTDAWYQGLANGKYASWLTAAWGPLFLQGTAGKTSGKWHATKLPQWAEGENKSGNWGGSTNSVINQTKNPIAAYELAKFVNTDPESTKKMANEQFLFPVTKSTLEGEEFLGNESKFYGGQKVNAEFAEIAKTVDVEFQWLPFMQYVYDNFGDTVGKAISERGEVVKAAATWQDNLVNYAKQQGFTVA